VSWLNDIKKQKSDGDRRNRAAIIQTVQRVREKAKSVNPFVMRLLADFGKACWGGGLFLKQYDLVSELRGRNWVWRIEHVWEEREVMNSAALEVYLTSNPQTEEFEFMAVHPESLSDVGPRYPCNQEGLKILLREVYERWLSEAHKYDLKA
jgi:hypothetical protein